MALDRGHLHEEQTVELVKESLHEQLTYNGSLVPASAPGPINGSCSQMSEVWLAAVEIIMYDPDRGASSLFSMSHHS